MKLNKSLFLLPFFAISHSACAGWFDSKISTIHTYLDGGIAVFGETNHECGSNRLSFDNTAPGFDRIYASLLAYESMGKTVRFQIFRCNGTVGAVNRIVSIN